MADNAVDAVVEKPWQKKLRMEKHYLNRGSRYPPFSIEPVPFERNRLAGSGMTDEMRALRKQWVKDQILSPNEPREVPALQPRNIFRRILAKPWDVIFTALKPVMGNENAIIGRHFIPKLSMVLFFSYCAYYQLKYHHNDWTKIGGFSIYESKPMIIGDRIPVAHKAHDDFCDRDFKSRTVLRSGKTSAVE